MPQAKRPFKLYFTNDGIFAGDFYGSFASAENARESLGKRWEGIVSRRWSYLYHGWWVITGPDGFQEAVGVGREHGKSLPTLEMVIGR